MKEYSKKTYLSVTIIGYSLSFTSADIGVFMLNNQTHSLVHLVKLKPQLDK